jgi:hypothetical protein
VTVAVAEASDWGFQTVNVIWSPAASGHDRAAFSQAIARRDYSTGVRGRPVATLLKITVDQNPAPTRVRAADSVSDLWRTAADNTR